MTFQSVLFESEAALEAAQTPLTDLHLNEIIAATAAGRESYDLQEYFGMPMRDLAGIYRRHAVFRDLERPEVAACVRTFTHGMRACAAAHAQAGKRHHDLQKKRHVLQGVLLYGAAVERFCAELAAAAPACQPLRELLDYLRDYLASAPFQQGYAAANAVRTALEAVRYRLHLEGTRIQVTRFGGGPGYAPQVLDTFARFADQGGREYRFELHDTAELNHVEAAILERVALLFPQAFGALDDFCRDHGSLIDGTLVRFEREVQFYLAYLEHMGRLRAHELPFCYPQITDSSKEVFARDMFDLALADQLTTGRTTGQRATVVLNDFELREPERIAVISGPNHGGKTTFARALGQLHYLARLGCPVPGSAARLLLCDRLFSLFERRERLEELSGKLEEELLRLRAILDLATPRSLLIMNETLGSTTLSDALLLGRKVLRRIIERGMLCVYVTFLEELSRLDEHTTSVVSEIDPTDPAKRTYKMTRRPADGRAYAQAIARKYALTREGIVSRLGASTGNGAS